MTPSNVICSCVQVVRVSQNLIPETLNPKPCVCVCVCVDVDVDVDVCVRAYVYIHIVCVYGRRCIYTNRQVNRQIHVRTGAHTHTNTHARARAHTNTNMHTHAHTQQLKRNLSPQCLRGDSTRKLHGDSTHTNLPLHLHTHTRAHERTHVHTHTHTNTHTHCTAMGGRGGWRRCGSTSGRWPRA